MPLVVFVDDEAYRTRFYREHLSRNGFKVELCTTLDEAFGLMDDPDAQISLLIQDMQMGRPLPDAAITMSNAEWEKYNQLSGLWFLVQKRLWLIGRKIPVLILTQRNPQEFQPMLSKELQAKGVRVQVALKVNTPARELPDIVKTYLG